MGSNDGLPNERPEHPVELDAYYIDQYEVTLALYRKFLDSGKHDSPPTWDDEAATTVGDRPAIGMKWADAEAYCTWAGKRLPTEAEWEKAARGTDARRYPWGSMQPFVDIANYNRGLWVSEAITLAAVTSGLEGMSVRHGLKEGGKSPYGLNHMAGNAAEWVADWYDRDYYQNSPKKNPTGPAQGEKRVLRGGVMGRSSAVSARHCSGLSGAGVRRTYHRISLCHGRHSVNRQGAAATAPRDRMIIIVPPHICLDHPLHV
jgi:formylglycine-generating enzyme required for sulfatase activity